MDSNSNDQIKKLPVENSDENINGNDVNIPTKEKTEKESYFEQLDRWVKQVNLSMNALNSFPYFVMTNYPHLINVPGQQYPLFPNGTSSPSQSPQQQRGGVPQNPGIPNVGFNVFNRNGLRPDNFLENQIHSEMIINEHGGYEYVIAPLWKRFVAELIDICILFVIKVIAAFMIVDIFELDFGFDLDTIRTSIEEDYTKFLIFSSEMIYAEIITKFSVCIYEALWTCEGMRQTGGATPGKIIMGIRILYVEAVVPLDQVAPGLNNLAGQPALKALLYPAQNPGFKRAFTRALSKNLLMAFLFPLCFVMLFFRNNRTSYDIMTKTIVVEQNPTPILRRL